MERRQSCRWLAAFGLSTCLAGPAVAEPAIEVFTTAGQPAVNVPSGVAVIELDAPGRLDAELSQDLPADPEVAEAMMREHMATSEWQETADRYADSYLGLARAWQLGVEKVPAVVIDDRYVIYGQPDVAEALREAEQIVGQEGRR
ncbi:TIGR03757 family integrating conjugative element protein [Vreelandella nigrificans]|uniref:TIGR03757 family integrating conjugative element protein n=1 Tax=Vreelandella nigrificans TaxID=2042704 RepID=A0A2A4HF84_9GAMM|nr:TIGR03757 family integrating conjugative element protein [Halomonas nigrificans]PCF93518.1 TIGR03757 family integrating conjugative element protein [Halomonas nigrificans]